MKFKINTINILHKDYFYLAELNLSQVKMHTYPVHHFGMAAIQPYFATQNIKLSVSSQSIKITIFHHEYPTTAF